MFEGKTINLIKPIGGLVAGQPKTYELWTNGSIITITHSDHVKAINKAIKESIKMNVDTREYLQYMIDQEGIID